MCGRYRRRSDKQRIAETFYVGMDLSDIYLEPEDDIAPGSIQPVVLAGNSGQSEIALMRAGDSNCPIAISSMRDRKASTVPRSGRTPLSSAAASFPPTPSSNGGYRTKEEVEV
jgi:putative SOS response-associated peptidase YedK